ncbi:hypothetical protein NBRC111894_4318 [Sporolactobacillus inulinus]|uniref:Uncharacterized protein n=1 Tax=Sporolactobacillus inulinus TaxID=2078 RepID=A0A4Y1ZIK7_9BACL|nr:hypothetical protein NBRC111894_4318 [Sporolactobacillus inulinus]
MKEPYWKDIWISCRKRGCSLNKFLNQNRIFRLRRVKYVVNEMKENGEVIKNGKF